MPQQLHFLELKTSEVFHEKVLEKVGYSTLKMKIIILFLICLALADGAAISNVEEETAIISTAGQKI